MVGCLRCGKCCILGGYFPCPHLILLKSGKTLCRIYKQRLQQNWKPLYLAEIIDENKNKVFFYCMSRKDDKRIIPGCPFNSLLPCP
jgi:hypothetical protein